MPSPRPAWTEWLTNLMLRDATAVIVKLLTRLRRGSAQSGAASRAASGPLVLRRSPLPGDAALVGAGAAAAGPRDRPRQQNPAPEAPAGPRPAAAARPA